MLASLKHNHLLSLSRQSPQAHTRPRNLRNWATSRAMYCERTPKGYKEAVVALNSLQSNANVLAAIFAAGPQPTSQVFDHTTYYLRRLGYKPQDLNSLNAIHITGTKGKGSTAAFCSSILTTINPQAKVGLFTSPHLVAVRERIRINGRPIGEELFASYFWEIWDRFEDGHGEPLRSDLPVRPAYFRYMTYMAYHAFLSEGVDATILEVGVGGLLDPTNLVPSPLVAGVTSLGIDHVNVLGKSIAEIAGHKGGIYKPGVPALTVEQHYSETLKVLKARALELKASSFTIVPQHPALATLQLGLAGDHQKLNATFAVALVNTFLASPRLPPKYAPHAPPLLDTTASSIPSPTLPALPSDPTPLIPEIDSAAVALPNLPAELIAPAQLSELFKAGLVNTKWPGRCQIIADPYRPGVTWSLDGAHTADSIACCGKWWKELLDSWLAPSARNQNKPNSLSKVLIFNCTSGRSGKSLLESFVNSLTPNGGLKDMLFEKVIITSNTTYKDGNYKGDLTPVAAATQGIENLGVQKEIAEAWSSITGSSQNVMVTGSIEEAVLEVEKSEASETKVLVTGSLHLVGGLIEVAGLESFL